MVIGLFNDVSSAALGYRTSNILVVANG